MGELAIVTLCYLPFTPEWQNEGEIERFSETGLVIQVGVQIFFRGELLVGDQFRLVIKAFPEFKDIQEDQYNQVERKGINR